MDITKMILEQLDKLRAEYEIHVKNINEAWPGMGRMPTDEQLICNALTTELKSIRKLNRKHWSRRKDSSDTPTITDFSGMMAEEEERLGVGSKEFMERHEEIMGLLDKIKECATDQSKRTH